jgi:hypothetical protein
MLCPPAPAAYIGFERRYFAGNWWYRTAPDQPWRECR